MFDSVGGDYMLGLSWCRVEIGVGIGAGADFVVIVARCDRG